MIQDVVARMAESSAQMKTWAVSLVTAVIVFSGLSNDPHWLIGLGGCLPVILFWLMDARYLHLNRCYRELFTSVAAGKQTKPFDMDYHAYAASVESVYRVARTWSVLWFYATLLCVMLVLSAILATMGETNEAQSIL